MPEIRTFTAFAFIISGKEIKKPRNFGASHLIFNDLSYTSIFAYRA
jgi:hypothetical protein